MKAQPNNFNLIRLVAAWLVLFCHCYDLQHLKAPFLEQHYMKLSYLALTAFFTTSGYLVTASWMHRRNIMDYTKSRVLRIVPALVVVLAFMTLILGPLVTYLPPGEYYAKALSWDYTVGNSLYGGFRLPGVFLSIPYPVAVNGSLWSLLIEFRMYILIALCGMLSLLRPYFTLAMAVAFMVEYGLMLVHPEWSKDHTTMGLNFVLETMLYGSAFWTGATLYLWQDRIPLRLSYALAAYALAVWLWYYIPQPYGICLHHILTSYVFMALALATPPLRWGFLQKNDFSYGVYIYAFPIQQTYLYLNGTHPAVLPFVVITTLTTFACAAFSWFCIEQPALRLKPARRPATA